MKKKHLALKIAASLCLGSVLPGGLSVSVTAQEPSAAEQQGHTFILTYRDSKGYRVGDQRVNNGTDTLNETDLIIPDGYVLNESWQPYSAGDEPYLYIDFQVVPTEDAVEKSLDVLPEEGGLGNSAVTVNYRLSDGTLIASESQSVTLRPAAGGSGQPVTAGTDFTYNAPSGYELLSAPETAKADTGARTMIDAIIAPVSADSQSKNSESALSQTTDTPASSEEVKSDTKKSAGISTGVLVWTAAAVCLAALILGAVVYLNKNRHKHNQ